MIRRLPRDIVLLFLGCVACSSSDDGAEEGGTEIDAATYGTQLPATICEQVLACECEHTWADEAACASALEQSLAEIAAWADERGLEYHPECGGAHIDFLDALVCGGEAADCGDLCEPWTGTAGDGEACEASIADPLRVDTCIEGFSCMGG